MIKICQEDVKIERKEELLSQEEFIRQIADENEARSIAGGKSMLACVHTYGCQQNVSDSEKIKGLLAEMGYGFTEEISQADLVLFNTCAVREHAEQRVFGNVGALKNDKKAKPSMIIALCGCMMQQEHIVEKIKRSYPHVDLVFGTNALQKLPQMLFEVIRERRRVFAGDESGGDIAEGLPAVRDGKVKAFLPVMYGCNNFCSYCIVPYVRGRERSRKPENILAEAKELVGAGYRDITLLGQNVNSYGKNLDGNWNFAKLLREINKIEGDFRIRFMTSHPKDATQELFNAMAECEKVSKHLHLPFQSGSSRILRQMNRGYTREQYLALVEQAKAIIPGLSLTSDIIVGFPGETYEDFEETLDVVRRVRFSNLFTFIYSRRKGTPAEKLDDPVPHEEKTKWFAELLEVQQAAMQEQFDSKVGKVFRVLAEGDGKTGEGYLTGRTDDNTIVDFPAPEEIVGTFVQVKITKALNYMLIGELN